MGLFVSHDEYCLTTVPRLKDPPPPPHRIRNQATDPHPAHPIILMMEAASFSSQPRFIGGSGSHDVEGQQNR